MVQWITTQLGHGQPLYLILYLALIVFFSFFYTAIVFNPTETADNLKKHGGFIPGIRPGSAPPNISITCCRGSRCSARSTWRRCLIPGNS